MSESCQEPCKPIPPFLMPLGRPKKKVGIFSFPSGKNINKSIKLRAGDIVAIAKLKDTQTGDTICDDKHPIVYPGLKIMKPVMSYALEVKSKNEIDKVSLGLHKLVEEDPSLEFLRNDETKEMLLSGVGQVHIDATLEKLRRKYGVDVNLHMPKVPYKETIHRMAQAQGKYKKQTGGHGQFGDCWLQIEPSPRGKGFEFHNKIVGGAIPRNFIPAVEKGCARSHAAWDSSPASLSSTSKSPCMMARTIQSIRRKWPLRWQPLWDSKKPWIPHRLDYSNRSWRWR